MIVLETITLMLFYFLFIKIIVHNLFLHDIINDDNINDLFTFFKIIQRKNKENINNELEKNK